MRICSIVLSAGITWGSAAFAEEMSPGEECRNRCRMAAERCITYCSEHDDPIECEDSCQDDGDRCEQSCG